ncbi:hypothetical protein L226DRAFT_273284 [Lentinus tigrinus ALCF2SS1-7]|uniref:DUF6699 domain-containing protein n=1 Tax=Lentinus tigrinus ALCF2SS1-6 TaxID=1328759 RepID=A0A5C2SB06_9APHY|nr:hypothetical protein L227DRAFT_611273 [Lentinus tigrinus ALCF2SS1-6]RPD69579.1 hypothetical protein L226DRAFT_273284 [Lentinus tigrinus ALCF2SS1-7]
MPSYSRGRTVRFPDAPRQAVPANEGPAHIHFDAPPREHDIYPQEPPARGRWAPEPSSPHLGTRPLPETPANSPAPRTAPLTTTASQSPPPSPTPSSSPKPQEELSAYLAGPYLRWNVRMLRLDESLRVKDPGLDQPAFGSKRKACILRFDVDGTYEWTVTVSRPDALPLTVWDVLGAIVRSLYSRVEGAALVRGEARYSAAMAERPRRLLGEEDTKVNVFRNIDLYPEESHSYFHGLERETIGEGDTQFVVRLGTRP